jgi:hypothetical protein
LPISERLTLRLSRSRTRNGHTTDILVISLEGRVNDRRKAVADDLRVLAGDLRNLVQTATTDLDARKRKERRWRLLSTAFALLATLATRRVTAKLWALLTGEQPPAKGPPPQPPAASAAHPGESPFSQSVSPAPADGSQASSMRR